MIKLMLMISAYPLTISSYKKTIRKKSWFDGLQLEFNSADCPHTKIIPYEKTFGLSSKRMEKRVKTVVITQSEVRKDMVFVLI